MQAHLLDNDRLLFLTYLEKATCYFEYGSGGSTVQASQYPNVQHIYSVESDHHWFQTITSHLKDNDRVTQIYVELNSPPNTWGHPGPNCLPSQQVSYSDQFGCLPQDERDRVDLVLIDGRFRVACCLKMYQLVSDTCIILFDDFFNRPSYHVILDYFTVINQTSDRNMVVLRKTPGVSPPPIELIQEYETVPL